MNIVNVPIDLIKENPENPRQIGEKEFRKLVESIKKFPQMLSIRPIVVNDAMIVLGGNMRLKACKEAGLKEIPIIKADDLTPEQQKEFIIKDNVGFGSWDWDKLANDFNLEELSEWGLEVLIDDKKEVQEDDFDVEGNLHQDPIIKLGDLIEIGSHRVLCGDNSNRENLELLMEKSKTVLLLTDPPYNVAQETELYGKDVSKSLKGLSEAEWDFDFKPSEFLDIIKDFLASDSWLYVFTSHQLFGEIVDWMNKERGHAGFCIWCKPNPMPSLAKNTWTFGAELCPFSKQGRPVFNYPDGEHCLNWWNVPKKSDGTHPTQKTIEVISNIIYRCSSKLDLVLDPFLGSGTTLIACEQLDRICYGIELNPKYCDVIVKRYKQYCIENNKEFTCKINDVDSANLF
jgi:DNA modification methylase